MDRNRFRKRTNYALPPKRPAPILDDIGQLRQPPSAQPQKIEVTQAVTSQQQQLSGQSSAPMPPKIAPKPEPPKPVYQQTKADDGIIDLTEPTHGGWLDAITPEPEEPIIETVQSAVSPVRMQDDALSSALDPAQETGAEAVTAVLQPQQTNISIQISMPELPKLHWPTLPQLPYKRIAIWSGIAVVAVAVVVAGILLARHFLYHPKPVVSVSTGSAALAAALSKPTFVPVAPKAKPQLAQAGSRATAFDGKRNSYSYIDSLNGLPITVSQQPLPANFSSASQALSTVAKSIGAKSTINASGTIAYLATNAKSQSQTLVFSMDSLLVFIKSDFVHDNGQWEVYVASLQQP